MSAFGSVRTRAISALALVVSSATCARADVGDAAPLAIAIVNARPMWKHVVPTAGHERGDPTAPTFRTWERDAEPEERRYEIVFGDGRSVEESLSGSAAADPFAGTAAGLKGGISAAAFADYRAATLVGSVSSKPLLLMQRFYRGKTWGFILGRSTLATHGVFTFSWTEVPSDALAPRLRAARACAKTGECGE